MMRTFLLLLTAFGAPTTANGFQVSTCLTVPSANRAQMRLNSESTQPLIAEQPNSVATINGDTTFAETVSKPTLEINIAKMACVLLGTVGTYILNNNRAMGPIMGCSTAALAASLILPDKLMLAALCGSFAGMAKIAVIPSVGAAMILGLITAATLELFDKKGWFVGMGGRLGLAAQLACSFQFLLWQVDPLKNLVASTLGVTASTAKIADFGVYNGAGSLILQLALPVFFTAFGALFMRSWKAVMSRMSKRLSTPTASVGATGLFASLCLPSSAAGSAFAGSFVAMSGPKILPNFFSLMSASALAGAWQVALSGALLGGWGGKLGTAAFLGVFSHYLRRKDIPSPAKSD